MVPRQLKVRINKTTKKTAGPSKWECESSDDEKTQNNDGETATASDDKKE
jgi:hypothetical protein